MLFAIDSGLLGVSKLTDYVEPLGKRILIRKDESRQKTRGGIVLPDSSEIPTITGRVVEISVQIERDEDFPIRKYDKVLFHPKNAIPVDFHVDQQSVRISPKAIPSPDSCCEFSGSC
jgi:co-chaperonin GroES (HSP10)